MRGMRPHCGKGHLLTEKTVYEYEGRRHCRVCRAMHDKNRREIPTVFHTIHPLETTTHERRVFTACGRSVSPDRMQNSQRNFNCKACISFLNKIEQRAAARA